MDVVEREGHNRKPKMSPKELAPEAHPEVRWGTLALIVGSVLLLVAVFAFLVFWSQMSPWLASQSSALIGLGAIFTGAAAIVGGVGLAVAGVAALAALRQVRLQRQIAEAALRQVRLQRRIADKQSSRECLWRFSDRWRLEIVKPRKEDGTDYWSRAGKALSSKAWKHAADSDGFVGKADGDVVDVLNFFESMAHMCRRGDLNKNLAYTVFSPNAVLFWARSEDFVTAYRSGAIRRTTSPEERPNEEDLTFWDEYEWFAGRLAKIDAKQQKKAKKEAEKKQIAAQLRTSRSLED